ncbi:hypothetical protein KC902_02980 [Candidatus Kaiserbacteria bacterium]|nr:hypothetical protein [Candidatus Kaiserbacteria bacterium]USN88632.1 MAG: hypothetical protein H6780_04055 [Candidatus Nomurabacteria bacterium]
MFANTTHVGFAQRVVATLVAGATLLWSIGAYATAQAANLTNVSDTLSDSDLSVAAGHTFAFTIPTGSTLNAASDFTITFPSGPGSGFTGVAASVIGDFSATVAGGSVAIDNFDSTGQVVTLSFDTTANAGEEVVVALNSGVVTNPDTAGSAEFVIATPSDTGRTRVALIDNVLVTAIVQTSFDFTITGLATSTAINGTSTTGSTSATEIPFGVLTAGEIKTMAQRLNVTTNAIQGFVVTVEQDSNLQSSTGADIDGFADGGYDDTPAVWASPSNTLGNENTYGHWGLTSSDNDLQGAGSDFGVDEWVSASTTPRAVMAHNSVSDGVFGNDDASGDDIGQTVVGYQIEITPLQEAADDYNTTLTYIATPTF